MFEMATNGVCRDDNGQIDVLVVRQGSRNIHLSWSNLDLSWSIIFEMATSGICRDDKEKMKHLSYDKFKKYTFFVVKF